VYSIGIIFWELATRCLSGKYIRPYKEFKRLVIDFQIIIQVSKNDLRPTIPKGCPSKLTELITRCWSTNDLSLPTCREILSTLSELQQDFVKNPALWTASNSVSGTEEKEDDKEQVFEDTNEEDEDEAEDENNN